MEPNDTHFGTIVPPIWSLLDEFVSSGYANASEFVLNRMCEDSDTVLAGIGQALYGELRGHECDCEDDCPVLSLVVRVGRIWLMSKVNISR